MLKVLFLIDSLNGGGAEKILLDILPKLDPQRFDVTLMVIWDRGYYSEVAKGKLQYNVMIRNRYGKSFGRKLVGLMTEKAHKYLSGTLLHKWYIKEDYDVEIAFLEGLSTKVISGSVHKKAAWIHIDMKANKWYKQFYATKGSIVSTYAKFDHIVTVSESLKTAFESEFGQMETISTIMNPIDVIAITEKSNCATDNVIPCDIFSFVTVGRLVEQKGYDRLLEAASRLLEEGYSFSFFIIGDGEGKYELESKASLLGITEHIIFIGQLSNPYNVMKQANVFVCSSRAEGLSTVVSEALVLGIPIISTACAGMHELLGDSEYGLLVDNSTDGIYEGMKRMMSEEGLTAHYSAKAKIRSSMFSYEKSIAEIESIIDE